MKYKVGDKVRIRRDLVIGDKYNGLTYNRSMAEEVKENNNKAVAIIDAGVDYYGVLWYNFEGLTFSYSEEMIEGLAESTDREKFKEWMRKLSSLDGCDRVWDAFHNCVMDEPNEEGYEDNLKILSDYLFGEEKKKMTKAEIEAELGYKIEIVE